MDSQPREPSSATLAAFGGAVLIGGVNFLAVKFSNEELEALPGAAIRFGAGAVLLVLISALWKFEFPRGRAALGAAIYGLLGFGVSYAFLYYAIQGLGAGGTSVILASVPLATLILAVIHRQEVLTARGVFGGVLAVIGIGILSLGSFDADLEPSYVGAAVLGAICIAESGVVIKGFPRAPLMSTNALGMVVGALFLIITALLFDASWTMPSEGKTWAALAWLIVMGSVGLFWLFLYIIERWTASAASYITTLFPVVAITLGALFADEEITIELILGGALVVTAVYVGALSQAARAAPPPARVEAI
jgi:drug/metabolite transporter (DMT)-like permease